MLKRQPSRVGVLGTEILGDGTERTVEDLRGKGPGGRQDVAEIVGEEVVAVLSVDRVHEMQVERGVLAVDEELDRQRRDRGVCSRLVGEREAADGALGTALEEAAVTPACARGYHETQACLGTEGVDALGSSGFKFVALGGERLAREGTVSDRQQIGESDTGERRQLFVARRQYARAPHGLGLLAGGECGSGRRLNRGHRRCALAADKGEDRWQ